MANKTRYILIDWEEQEISILDTREELTKELDTLAQHAGLGGDDIASTDDLTCVVLKTSCSSKPTQEILQLEVKRNWKTI